MKITSQPLVFLDTTDSRKLEVYVKSNHPTIQLYNNDKYTPDWSTNNLTLTASIFIDSEEITPNTIKWYKRPLGDTSDSLIDDSNKKEIKISSNMTKEIITFICCVTYQGLEAFTEIAFTRVSNGVDGSNGKDGTSVNILGSFNSLGELKTAHPTGSAGDAYLIKGVLYVWDVDDNIWKNVGSIQGPAGENGQDAKSIILNGDTQIFKVGKDKTISPNNIIVTAHTLNTTITTWSYSIDGGQTFSTTSLPNGVARNGNTVTIVGSAMTNNSIIIKASDGTYSDTYTVYKTYDGNDGANGANGQSASMAFLTNENVSFAADASGKAYTTTFNTSVVVYNGTNRVVPQVGDITCPSGITATKGAVNDRQELPISFTVASGQTLGSPYSNNGEILIPVTINSVVTNLVLTWSKVNTGAKGDKGDAGAKGSDGQTSYLHIKYSNDNGSTFTANNGETVGTYIGRYVDFNEADSDIVGSYTWSKFIGDNGQNGADAYTIALSNEAATFPCNSDGNIVSVLTTTTDVIAFKGNTSCSFTIGALPTVSGLTLSKSGSTVTIQANAGSSLADSGSFTIPVVVNGLTFNKIFSWAKSKDGANGVNGSDAVVFQIYSSNGYILSKDMPSITLQTFAYIGDIPIASGATYQWYQYNEAWNAITGATNNYLSISQSDVAFTCSYMCKMQFGGNEYVGVATIEDKGDTNKVFTTKPKGYSVGDIWIVGGDYQPKDIIVGTLLKATVSNTDYSDTDWGIATKYDETFNSLQKDINTYNEHFSFDANGGVKITAKDANDNLSPYSTTLSSEKLSFNYGNNEIASISGTKMKIKEAEIESPLTVTGKYDGATMLQAPTINIGGFSIIVESNGSLSIVVN